MKKTFKLFSLMSVLILAMALSFTACGDDDDDDNGGNQDPEKTYACVPTATIPSLLSPGTPTNDATSTIGGKLVVGNGTHWVYTVDATCAAIQGATVINDKVQLKINAGTIVVADTSALSYLSIRPGAQLNAVGTSTNPIVFTSGAAIGERSASDWGGIVMHGKAKCNASNNINTATDTEIATGSFGGDSETDNSGTIQYVRVEFAGYEMAAGKEFNGIFLAGVGSGTTINHVQVHRGSDDGIEIFGGSVSLKNIVLTYNDDDQFDLDDGWHGHASNFVLAKGANIGDAMIEYDGLGKDATRATQSFFSNFTFLAQGAAKKNTLINIKAKGALVIVNSLFVNFEDDYLVHQGEQTGVTPDSSFFASTVIPTGMTDTNGSGYISALFNNRFENCKIDGTAVTSAASLISSLEDGTNNTDNFDDATQNITVGTMSFTAPTKYWGENGAADFVPSSNPTSPSPYTSNITDWAGNTLTLSGVNYLGAVSASGTNWMSGWTAFPEN